MKKTIMIIIISFSFLYLASCTTSKKEINVLFENNIPIEYSIKKLDTFHQYKCNTEKQKNSKKRVTLKLCDEFFISNPTNDITRITNNDFQKNKPISLKKFIENYSHLRGVENDTKIFFLEKNNDNTYQKYQVRWSKNFIESEPSQKEFEKF